MAQMTIAEVATHGFWLDGKWVEEGDVYEVKAPYDGVIVFPYTDAKPLTEWLYFAKTEVNL